MSCRRTHWTLGADPSSLFIDVRMRVHSTTYIAAATTHSICSRADRMRFPCEMVPACQCQCLPSCRNRSQERAVKMFFGSSSKRKCSVSSQRHIVTMRNTLTPADFRSTLPLNWMAGPAGEPQCPRCASPDTRFVKFVVTFCMMYTQSGSSRQRGS